MAGACTAEEDWLCGIVGLLFVCLGGRGEGRILETEQARIGKLSRDDGWMAGRERRRSVRAKHE